MANKRALALLLSANIISGFAQGISMLSIPWYFTTINKNESLFSFFYGIVTLCMIPWSLYAGTLIDKYSRKKIFILTSLGGFIILMGAAVNGFYQNESNTFIALLVFAATIFIYNIHYPTLYAFGQEITKREHYGKTNSYFEIQGQVTTVIAGAIGAILLEGCNNNTIRLLDVAFYLPFNFKAWQLHEIFLMDGITYAISMILIGLIKYNPVEHAVIQTGSVIKRMQMGWEYLKNNKKIFLFGNMSYAIFVFLLVEVHLLMAWYTNNHLLEGASVYASSEIMYAAGALFAGIAIRSVFKNTTLVRAIITLMIVFFFANTIITFTNNTLLFYLYSVVLGVANAGTRVLRITWLFNHVPNNVMGRTGGIFQVINILLRFLFVLLFSLPYFSKGSNVTWAYFIGGLFILLSAIPLIKNVKHLE